MALNYQKNYYEILDVTVDSTQDDIKSAYRKLARKYHPDINKTPEAISVFKDVIEAYKILSNPQEREKYNTLKGYFKSAQNYSPNNDFENSVNEKKSNWKQAANEKNSCKTPENKKNKKNSNSTKFDNESIHKQNSTKSECVNTKEKSKPQSNNKTFFQKILDKITNDTTFSKGKNITTEVVISPQEAYNGCKRVVNIVTTKTCPKCFGKKFINSQKCPDCQGKGEITTKRKITVTIPKGIKSGTKLRIKGEGANGKNGANNGDLILLVKITSAEKLKIEKLNVYYNVAVTPFEAALGDEILINLFNEKIKLKLPPNTCSGQKFRLANEGLKKNGKTGDLIVTVSIEFSKDLSDDEIELYKKLKDLSKRKNETNKS